MQQGEADKVKYWQYKLQQKKNSQKANNKAKNGKPKTPQKSNRNGYLATQDNFFINTIQKFKGFLQENSIKKKPLNLTQSHKRNKQFETKKSYQLTDHKEKDKKEEKKLKPNKSKIQPSRKQTKPSIEQKQKIVKFTPNKSKSKSRSKSQKYKMDRSKVEIPKQKLNASLSNEVSKKRSLKTKQTTKKVETIMLESLDQESSWKKKLMDTIIVHSESSRKTNQINVEFVSNFKIWEEHQERQFNKQKNNKKILQKYFRGLLQRTHFEEKCKKVIKTYKLKVDFKEIVKSQEVKLLFLKQQLSNLKNTANLNESLDFLITKVNQNIYSLQNIEGPQNHREVSNHSSKKSQSKQEIARRIIRSNEELEAEQDTNKTVFSESKHSISLSSSNWQQQKIDFQLNFPRHEQKSNFKDLVNSNSDEKQQVLIISSVNKSQGSLTLRQEQQSSSFRMDQKFGEISLRPLLFQESPEQQWNVHKNHQQSIKADVKPVKADVKQQKYEIIPLKKMQIAQLQSFQALSDQKQPKIPSKNEIKIEQDQQEVNPIFKRSVNKKNFQPMSQFQLQLIQVQSQTALFNVLKHTIDQNYAQEHQFSFLKLDQKTYILQTVFDYLITETAQFCHRFNLKNKISPFNPNNATENLEGQAIYQSQEQIVPEVQVSDKYIFQLARKILQYAYTNKMTERLRKPLGMSSAATLKCIRKLQKQEQYQQSNIATQSFQEQVIEQYSEVIDSNYFQHFEQNFSAQPQNPYQLIFNRCIYDTINFLLDDYRPFGSKGMPGICSQGYRYVIPSLQDLKKRLGNQLQAITKLKMGCVKAGLSQSQFQQRLKLSLALWKEDLLRQIQKEYNYSQEDDTIQRCELMMQIQELIIRQQATNLILLFETRMQRLDMV